MKEENINENVQPQMMGMDSNVQPQTSETSTMMSSDAAPVMESAPAEMVAQPDQNVGPVTEQVVPVMNTMSSTDNVGQTVESNPAPVMMSSDVAPVMESAPVEVIQPSQNVEPVMSSQPVQMNNVEEQNVGVSPVQMTDPNQMNINSSNGLNPTPMMNGGNTTPPSVNQIQGEGKKNKSKVVIVAVLLAIVVIGLGVFGFMMFQSYNNPRNRFMKSVEKYMESNNIITETANMNAIMQSGANVKLDGTLKANVDGEELLNGKIKLNVIDSPSTKEQYYNIVLLNNDEQIIDLEGLFKEEKLYFQLKEIFSKFYFIEEMTYTSLSTVDTKTLEDNIAKSLEQFFTEDKFVSSKEKISVNGTEKNTMKISIAMSQKDLSELVKLIVTNLSNDDNALKVFVTEDLTLDSIKTALKDTISSIDSSMTEMSTEPIVTYTVYLDGYEMVKQTLSLEEVVLTIEGVETGRLSLSVAGVDYISGTFSKNNLKVNVKIDETTTITVDVTHQETISSNNVDANYNVIVSGDIAGTKFDITSVITMKVDNQNTIPSLDLSTAKSIEDMTEEELEEIQEKLMKVPAIKSLVDMYDTYMNNTMNSFTDDMYDTDYGMDNVFTDERCNAAYSCITNDDGTMSCKYMDENADEIDVTCEFADSFDEIMTPSDDFDITIYEY